jgi:hypothetical protein
MLGVLAIEEGKINNTRLYRCLYKTARSVYRLGAKLTPARGAGKRGAFALALHLDCFRRARRQSSEQ